jgi:hypothetical protein
VNTPADGSKAAEHAGPRCAPAGHDAIGSRTAPYRRAVCVLLTAVLLGVTILGGCGALGWAAQIFKPKTPAVFRLANRPTLVMVDDTQRHLGQPVFVRVMSEQIGRLLLDEKVVTQIVPMKKLDALMAKVGDEFDRLGVDQIGQAVGAEQVVHVHINSAILYPQPSLLQPTGVAFVKVIDVVNRRRLFPDNADQEYDQTIGTVSPRGFKVKVEFLPRGSADEDDATQRKIMNQLALRLGRDCARLFHDYMPREPGQKFE